MSPCIGCHDTGVVVTVEPATDEAPGGDVIACPLCGHHGEPEHVATILSRQLAALTRARGSQLAMVRADDALVFVTTGREADTLERLIRAQHGGRFDRDALGGGPLA